MDTFRWIAAALSIILGLGITRVLSGAVAAFRSRHRAELDWVPFIWAASIFILQIQFWWAIIELPQILPMWTLPTFMLLLAIPVLLFTASAMTLPAAELEAGDSLGTQFARDGRWGLICLSGYAVVAFTLNVTLFGSEPVSASHALLAVEFVMPLTFLASGKRQVRSAVAVLFLAVAVLQCWLASPKAY